MLRLAAMAWYVWTATSLLQHGRDAAARDVLFQRWKMKWCAWAIDIVGLDVRIVHGAAKDVGRGRLVVANHRTPLDILAVLSLFGGHFLANHRVAKAPIVGPSTVRIGTVFVDREDRRSGAKAIRQMRSLLEDGRTVVVFPEGTTHGGDEVREFKGGAFTAAKGIDVDVVPVGLAYVPGHELTGGRTGNHVRQFMARRRTRVWVAIGDPIPMAEERRGVDEAMRVRVQELVTIARAAADRETS